VAKRSDARRWAVIGAQARLLQISEETAAIHRAFPELRGGTGRGRAQASAERSTNDGSAAPL